MKVIKVLPENFASNSYILTADGKTAVVIDPSEVRILDVLKGEGLDCRYALLTHGHFDHIGACGELCGRGAAVCCGGDEKNFIFGVLNRSICPGVPIPDFQISRTFSDGEKFTLAGIEFTAISTPGHTAGSMCYVTDGVMFSGDTLFRLGVGRTDLPTGSGKALMQSIKKLFALNGDYKVYTGHGEDTDLNFERRHNPFAE